MHIVCLLQPPDRLLQLKGGVVPALVPHQDSFTYLCARQLPLQLANGDCVDFLVVPIRVYCLQLCLQVRNVLVLPVEVDLSLVSDHRL